MDRHRVAERRRHWNAGLRNRFKQLEDRWNQLHPPLLIDGVGNRRDTDAQTEEGAAFGLSPANLAYLGTQRRNVLLIGTDSRLAEFLPVLTRTAMLPIESCRAGRLALPHRSVGTLLLHDADRLTREEQEQMFGWISCAPPPVQVVTAASVPLFPLVVRQHFSEALFYRLSQVCLIVR